MSDQPVLTSHDGGQPHDVAEWEARARLDVAILIERYLSQNPPPAASAHAEKYRSWASGLRAAGEAHLVALAARRLRAA